ncbi:MAG: hypothetical protein SH850_02130 [Planctomycetaceae bacterium]|nr:hypothetical protein [Planctomycetaceae bacterium]
MIQYRVWNQLWNDDSGAILSAELVIILTVVVLGLITGLTCLQQAIVGELQDVSAAFTGLNQSYFTSGFRGCLKIWGRTSGTAGSMFVDRRAGGIVLESAELGVGRGAVTYGVAPSTVTPSVRCDTCPPDAAPAVVPCDNCPPTAVAPVPCDNCPPLTPGAPVIPQGPAPQLSPQSW